jgi:hypothetical protein
MTIHRQAPDCACCLFLSLENVPITHTIIPPAPSSLPAAPLFLTTMRPHRNSFVGSGTHLLVAESAGAKVEAGGSVVVEEGVNLVTVLPCNR